MAVIPMECVCKYIYHVMCQCYTPPVRNCLPFGMWIFQSNRIQFPLFSSFRQRAPIVHKRTQRCSVLYVANDIHSWMVKASTHTKCATNTSNAIAHFYVNDVIAKVNIPWKSETYFADVIAVAVAAVLCCSVRFNMVTLRFTVPYSQRHSLVFVE